MNIPKRTVFWPYAVLLAEIALFYRKVLFHPGTYAIPWDLRYYHLPLVEYMARSFRRGHLPLWDPYTYCGWPIYAELQTQLFYPPTLLAALVSNLTGGRHLLYFLELQLIAHILLGGIFAYALLRRLGSEPFAALIGATVYQLGPFFVSQTQHLCAIDAAAWLPLSWLAIVALAERFDWRWTGVLAVSLAMSILAGFPAVTAVAFVSCFLLACALLSVRGALGLAIGNAWAATLSAIQLLPTAELHRLSVAKYRGDWVGDGGGHPLQSLISMLIPNYWGIFQFNPSEYKLPWNPTFLYLYFGLVGLALAAISLIKWKSRYTLSFLALTIACLLWMLGEHTPVGLTIFRLLPAAIQGPLYAEYALPAFALGMAVLAGLGSQWLLTGRSRAIQAAVIAACAVDLIAVGSSRPMNTASLDDEPGIGYDHFDSYAEVPPRIRELVNQTSPPARIDTVRGSLNWVAGMLFEVPTASGNDPMAPERVIQARLSFGKGERWQRNIEIAAPDSRLIDLLNVRFIVSNGALEDSRFRKIAELPENFVYENPAALPRFFLVSRIRKAAGMAEAIAMLRSADFDPSAEAIVEGDVNASVGARGIVRTRRYEALEVELEVDSSAPAYLVTSETNYPGWFAAIDGQPQPIFTTNVAFRGLPVPAGQHTVTMRFHPTILWQGATLSLVSWATLTALLFRNWISPRRSSRPSTSSM